MRPRASTSPLFPYTTLFRSSIRIRDNGTGVPWSRFTRQLTAVGASGKRGSKARGFRGVGRLAGLGYCQEVIFRSRTSGEAPISEDRKSTRLNSSHVKISYAV